MINNTKEEITKFLFIGKDYECLTDYDLVIVLGNNFYKETALVLKKLYDDKKINEETKIIISGNKGTINKNITETEAEIIYKNLLELGLDLDCVLEKNATNVRENLVYAKEIVKNLDEFKKVLIIGKSFIARRVLMVLVALKENLAKFDFYGIEVDIKKEDWYLNKAAKKRVLEELERIAKYTIKNDLKLEEE